MSVVDPSSIVINTSNGTIGPVSIVSFNGYDSVSFTVTALNGQSTRTYTSYVVNTNTDTSLSTFTINGMSTINDGTIYVNEDETDATIEAIPTYGTIDGTVEYNSTISLTPGVNEISFTVTSINGTTEDYNATVYKKYSSDTSLSTFTINETSVTNGETIEVDSANADIVVIPNSGTVEYNSTISLIYGDNEISFTVTALDGTIEVYNVTVNCIDITADISLSTFTINETSVTNDETIYVSYDITEANVVAIPNNGTVDYDSVVTLSSGSNKIDVTVTSINGTSKVYNVTVFRKYIETKSLLELSLPLLFSSEPIVIDSSVLLLNSSNISIDGNTGLNGQVLAKTENKLTWSDAYSTDSTGNGNIYIGTTGTTQFGQDITITKLGYDINGETDGDASGISVSLSADGTRVAIGAILNDGIHGTNSGHCRIYEYGLSGETTGWFQLGHDIDGETGGDESGYSVSLSTNGQRVAIGAIYNNNNGHWSGHCRVYEYGLTGGITGWIQMGNDIDGETGGTQGDQSGTSVSLSADGTRVAIGARYNDGIHGTNSGHCRIYEYGLSDGTTGWFQLGHDIDGETGGDQSGYSVSLSTDGQRVAIGAIYNNDNGTKSGQCRVYEYGLTGGITGWIQQGKDIDGGKIGTTGDASGWSVSLSANGTRVAIGAPHNNDNGIKSGQCRVYEYGTSGWIQLGTDINGETGGDELGYSVSLSADGTHVAIGAPNNNGYSRVYELVPNTIITTINSDVLVSGNITLGGHLVPTYTSKPGIGEIGYCRQITLANTTI